jgi:cell division protein FtsB
VNGPIVGRLARGVKPNALESRQADVPSERPLNEPSAVDPSPAGPRATSRRGSPAGAARRRAALAEAAYLVGLLSLAGAVYSTLVLLPSKLATRDLRGRRDALTAEVADLERSIALLDRDARALHDDPWVVERTLRRRLGFLRPGERVFRAPAAPAQR